jgi:hypothetical protein
MPEDIYGIEEYKNASTDKGQNVPAPTGDFLFPELQLFKGELHF